VTVPIVRSGKGMQRVGEVLIDDSQPWRRRLLRTIELNYAKARSFEETFPFVRELVEIEGELLADYNERNLSRLAKALGLDPGKLVRSSSIQTTATGTELLVELTRALGGTTYLSGDGAGGYQEAEPFAAAGIELRLQGFAHPVYPQQAGSHVPGLSIVDALLNCGFVDTRALIA
jgi:hypothetical protein